MPRWAGLVAIAFGLAMLTPALSNRVAFLLLYPSAVLLIGAFSVYLHRSGGDVRNRDT